MDILTTIADNQALLDAVKRVILDEFADTSVEDDSTLSDEQLGQMYRARLVGLQKVDKAFREIQKHKTAETGRGRVNMAR